MMDIESLSLVGGWRRLTHEPAKSIPWQWTTPYLPDTNPWPPSPPQQGWECPRCHRINSPSMLQCTCKPGDGEG